MSIHKQAPHGWGAGAGLSKAVTARNLAQSSHRSQGDPVAFHIEPLSGVPFSITVKGRVRWALERLIASEPLGCMPITEPAPRWSSYIYSLRLMGLEIETLHEAHEGDFAGHHGRYVLKSRVRKAGAQ